MSFDVGQRVAVLSESPGGSPRTPQYLRGRIGTVVGSHGVVVNPIDHRDAYPPLYTVLFEFESGDEVTADIHEEWLEPVT